MSLEYNIASWVYVKRNFFQHFVSILQANFLISFECTFEIKFTIPFKRSCNFVPYQVS
jgi:hypothetical protein